MMNFTMTEDMIEAMNLLVAGGLDPVMKAVKKAKYTATLLDIMKGATPVHVIELTRKMCDSGYECTTQYVMGILQVLVEAGAVVKTLSLDTKDFVPLHGNFGEMVPIARYALK